MIRYKLRERASQIWWVAIAILLVMPSLAVQGQQNSQQDSQQDIDRLNDYNPVATDSEAAPTASARIFPQVWCQQISEAATRTACWKAYEAGLVYHETGLRHRTRVFAWQHFSTRVIFVAVLILVGTGIFFAWIQFKRDGASERHELEIGVKGVKINSSALGLIILALSLAFFYLYLAYVYSIHELI